MSDPSFARGGAGTQSRLPPIALHVLLMVSGFAGFGCLTVLLRLWASALGQDALTVLAITAALFLGCALGALVLDRPIARSSRPGLWYAGLEAGGGLWALALVWLMPSFGDGAGAWMGSEPDGARRWGLTLGLPALVLLPATFAMGARIPAAERLYARFSTQRHGFGGLYAAHAGGAVFGALGMTLWLVPALGYASSLAVFASINLASAALVLVLGSLPGVRERAAAVPKASSSATTPHHGLSLLLLAVTSFLGLGYQVGVTRVLSQVLEDTVYSEAAALAVSLFGLATGAGLYQFLYASRRLAGWDMPA
ncbi:MAG: hypothetical protein AAGF76_10395, partial [Pseudomonadota bacterium]